jgi:hypothetical protein
MKKCNTCNIEIKDTDDYGCGNQKWYCMDCFCAAWRKENQ